MRSIAPPYLPSTVYERISLLVRYVTTQWRRWNVPCTGAPIPVHTARVFDLTRRVRGSMKRGLSFPSTLAACRSPTSA